MSTGDAPAGVTAPASRDRRPASGGVTARLGSLGARHPYAVALGFGVVLITALNALWLSLETRPPHWDKARHLTNSLLYHDTLSAGDIGGALVDYHLYPPLMYWLADGFYAVFGTTDSWAATLSQSLFLVVLVFSTYGLGSRLWSRRVGFLAAVLVATSPMVVSQFKDFMVDAPLTAMTVLGLYLLVRSEEFSHRGASLALGAAVGLGMLTKWNLALYLALPAAVAVIRAAIAGKRAARLTNVAIAAVTALAICGTWYLANAGSVVDDLRGNTEAAEIEGDPPVASVASILWYGWNLVSNQLFLLPFLLFAVGLVLMAFRREARRKNFYPVLLVVGTYVAYTALVNKDARYTEPMLPAVAVIAVYWFDALAATARRLASAGLVAYGAVTFAAISFGIGFLPGDAYVHLGKSCAFWPYFTGPCPGSSIVSGVQSFTPSGEIRTMRGIRIWSQNGYIDGAPSGEHWYQEALFQTASRVSRSRTVHLTYSGFDFIWFNGFAMDYFGEKYGIEWVATPEQGDFAAVWDRPGEQLAAPAGFTEIERHRLPDGGSLALLSRAGTADGAADEDDLAALSSSLGHPIYWVGSQTGTTMQVSRTGNNVFVRYVPAGAAPGQAVLTVGSYDVGNAYEATLAAAESPSAVRVDAKDDAVAFFDRDRPASVYLAYPGSTVQIEVFDPAPGRARSLIESGAVRAAG